MAQKIDSLLDVGKISGEIELIAKKMSEEFGKATNLSTFTDGGVGAGNTKELDAMKKQITDLEAKIRQYNNVKQQQLTIEQKVAKQAFDSKAKWEAIANSTSKNIDVLTRMTAQMKVQEVVMKNNYNPQLEKQNALYTEAAAKHAVLQKEFLKTSQATGVMGRQSLSAYGGTFQLTQIMRELPNFAIDARLGFMSLSNNIPMLIDSFKLLSERVDDTGKKLGNVGALKQFMKSLLSLNTIMIVVSTFLVLFGDDIWNVAKEFFNATTSAQKFANALNEVEKSASNMLKKDKENVAKFIHDYKLAFKNGDEEMLKQLKERGAKEFDLNQQQLDLIVTAKKNAATDIFKDYLQKAEDAYFDEVIIQKRASAEANAAISLKTAQDKFRAASDTKSVKGRIKASGLGAEKLTFETLKRAAYDKSFANELFETLSITGVGQDIVDELKKVIAENEILKYLPQLRNKSYVLDPNKPTWSGESKKQFTEINVKREYYQSEEAMLKRLADLEKDITKENEEGVLNSYEKRGRAADLYYRTVEQLAMQEKFIAILNEKQKTEAAKRANQQKYENNVTKFKAGSPEALRSANELAVGNATLEANEADAILKINDDYTKKILDASRKRSKDLLAIDKDLYQDEVYLLEQKEQRQLKFADQDTTSLGEMGIGVLGVKKDKSFDKEQQKRNIRKEKLLQQQMKAKTGSKEYDDIWKELGVIKQEETDALVLESMRVTEEAKASIVSDSIDTLKSLWDSYYQYQQDKIDEQLATQTAINDERIKQYEDETEAGIHSQQELSDFKERNAAYQQSLDEEAARKKEELEKKQFLMKQAFSLGEVWINYAVNATKYAWNPALVGWMLASAIASTALIAAQTIPAFKDGVDDFEGGKAILGDGYKHELAVSPKGMFISDNTPKLYDLDPHTTVFPDVNKVNLNSLLSLRQVGIGGTEKRDDRLMRELIGAVKSQKQGNFYGMPLIRQMNMAETYSKRKRGLMN